MAIRALTEQEIAKHLQEASLWQRKGAEIQRTFVHSGFGLGVERTVAWICGLPHIRETIAFPRQIHRLYP